MRLLALALALLPLSALAETPMTGDEFDAYMTGKTLTFSANGLPYGIEYYAPSRRVIWSFIDGDCVMGEWYEDDGAICFVYENDPQPKCWAVFRDAGGIRAEFLDGTGDSVIYEVEESEPLICDNMGA
ncbi:MAG: hypothetical protein GVY31_01360 [Alphaproteobacteria bacterium]|jgi:hypothetical protein|nr:hypothetical protein [Alphaproteobacteria bacterium]